MARLKTELSGDYQTMQKALEEMKRRPHGFKVTIWMGPRLDGVYDKSRGSSKATRSLVGAVHVACFIKRSMRRTGKELGAGIRHVRQGRLEKKQYHMQTRVVGPGRWLRIQLGSYKCGQSTLCLVASRIPTRCQLGSTPRSRRCLVGRPS